MFCGKSNITLHYITINTKAGQPSAATVTKKSVVLTCYIFRTTLHVSLSQQGHFCEGRTTCLVLRTIIAGFNLMSQGSLVHSRSWGRSCPHKDRRTRLSVFFSILTFERRKLKPRKNKGKSSCVAALSPAGQRWCCNCFEGQRGKKISSSIEDDGNI